MSNGNTPIQLQGYYKEPYQQIVQPQQIWPVSKYLLREWLPYLKPAELWLIIAARQLSYRNQNCPWFQAYDETLAQGAGLNTQTFRRMRRQLEKEETPLAQFLQVSDEERRYVRRNGRLRPAETRYTIRLDDPLTPHHATALTNWLTAHAPETITGETIQQLLQTAVHTPDLLETEPQRCAQSPKVERSDTPNLQPPKAKRRDTPNLQSLIPNSPLSNCPALTVSDLIPQLFGKATRKSKQIWGETAVRLQRHITQPERVHIETQYLRQAWLPRLNPGPTLLLVYLRSFSYINEETGERRNTIQFQTGDLEKQFGISSSTLRRWLNKIQTATGTDNPLGSFLPNITHRKLASQQVETTYQLAIHTPLVPEDVASYYQHLLHPAQTTTLTDPLNDVSLPLAKSTTMAVGKPSTEQIVPTAVVAERTEDSPLTATIHTANNTHHIKWQKGNRDAEKPFYKKGNRDSYLNAKLSEIAHSLGHEQNHQGSRANCSPQNRDDGQIVNHASKGVASKMIITEIGLEAKSSPQRGGEEQNDQGSRANCSPLKDSNHLIRSIIENISLNNKQQSIKQKLSANQATPIQAKSFAVVAVGDVSGLITQLEITGQARKIFQTSQLTLEEMMAWYLWASHQSWCNQPVAYTIQRVRHNESPPDLYGRFASLSWQTWQLYAVFYNVRDYIDLPRDVLNWPDFEAWGERFGHLSLETLPFGVGAGLETAVDTILDASPMPVLSAESPHVLPVQHSLASHTKPLSPVNARKFSGKQSGGNRTRNGRSCPHPESQQQFALNTQMGETILLTDEQIPNELSQPPVSHLAPDADQRTLWQMTLQELSYQLPKATFHNWLQGATLIEVEDGGNGRFVVQLKNKYAKEWVDNRLAPTILRTWSAIAGQAVQARFVC